MKHLTNYINEDKNSNLHQFVQYLKDTGKEGKLKSTVSSIEKLYNEADLDNCQKFNYNCIEDCWAFDDYMESIGLDPYKDELQDWEGYFDYCKKIEHDEILKHLNINKDGCIYIEREILIPNFSANTDLYKKFKEQYNGSLGIYWTYLEGNGLVQNGDWSMKVEDVNRLLKQYEQMKKMFKQMNSKGGKRRMMRQMGGMGGMNFPGGFGF